MSHSLPAGGVFLVEFKCAIVILKLSSGDSEQLSDQSVTSAGSDDMGTASPGMQQAAVVLYPTTIIINSHAQSCDKQRFDLYPLSVPSAFERFP